MHRVEKKNPSIDSPGHKVVSPGLFSFFVLPSFLPPAATDALYVPLFFGYPSARPSTLALPWFELFWRLSLPRPTLCSFRPSPQAPLSSPRDYFYRDEFLSMTDVFSLSAFVARRPVSPPVHFVSPLGSTFRPMRTRRVAFCPYRPFFWMARV